jgi:Rieske 2Fe-2S family protein
VTTPAPIPVDELVGPLLPFGQSTMLPAIAYTSEEVLAWERRHLFAGSWTCVGRLDQLTRGGDGAPITQRAEQVGDTVLLLTFAEAEIGTGQVQVQAFANFCRHRGHELLPVGGCSDRRALVCPYHGWSYGLNGQLLAAPRMGESFEPRRYGLVALPAVNWHGWVFVNASGSARPFAEHLGTLDGHVAAYRSQDLVTLARHDYEVAANWKLIVENYHECYHCPQVHPQLCAVSPPNSGANWRQPGAWVGGTMDLRDHAQTMSLSGASAGVMLDGVDPRRVVYVGLFPNLLLSLHPDYVMTHRLTPLSAARTRVECSWLFHPDTPDPGYAVQFWDLTNRQDWAACESVQRGVSSGHFSPGPLAPNETAVYDWVTMLARAYRDPGDIR